MTRNKGINLVKKHDHLVPSDLKTWLNYVDLSEEYFWRKADTFRSTKVWWIKDNKWFKDNIWGEPKSYGKVSIERKYRSKYEIQKKN